MLVRFFGIHLPTLLTPFDFETQGPEDGGTVVAASTGAPASINTFEASEDSGTVGGANPPYIPMVHAVAIGSPSLTTTNALPVVQAEAEVDSPGAGGSSVPSLLESLDHSLDKRLTVGEWVRAHPVAAARVSPTNVHQILAKISFSLEQASVAAEIAAGLESATALTCEHVRQALLACPYARADVAKAMVPTVRDPDSRVWFWISWSIRLSESMSRRLLLGEDRTFLPYSL